MVTYCKNDVLLTEKTYNKLTKDKEEYKFSDKSIELEHKIRDVIRRQTEHGFYLALRTKSTYSVYRNKV